MYRFICLHACLIACTYGFWVGPLWGYKQGEQTDENHLHRGQTEHKYPAWIAPANLDEVLKRVAGKRQGESSQSLVPVSFVCSPMKTTCGNGGKGPEIVKIGLGYLSLCRCYCPPTHTSPGCL